MVDAVMRDALAQTWLAIDATTDDPAERDRLRKAAREAIPPVRDVFEDLVLNPPDDPPGTPLLDVIERRKREMKR